MKVKKYGIYLAVCMLCCNAAVALAEDIFVKADTDFLPKYMQEKYESIRANTISFLNKQRFPKTGLVESFRGSSKYCYLAHNEQFSPMKNGYLDNQCFVYDQAVCVMAYLICGERDKAKRILEEMEKEFHREKNWKIGLYTSYRGDAYAPEGTLLMGIDGDRIHVGPNMWIAIACLHYLQNTGNNRFLGFTIDLAKWAAELNHYKFSDGEKGGVCMGSGWGPDWTNIYSTENCIDYYAVLNMLFNIYMQADNKVKKLFENKNFTDKEINKELSCLKRWFREVAYNKETGGLNGGYAEDEIDPTKAIDVVSDSIMAIGPKILKSWGIDPSRLIEFAEEHLLISDRVSEIKVDGFDFTVPEELNNPRQRLIWIEGTAQMIVAYKIMSRYYEDLGLDHKAGEYRSKAIKYIIELDKLSVLVKLPAFTLPYTSANPKDKERFLSFKEEWEIPRGSEGRWVECAASTAWRLLTLIDFNPMKISSSKL
ncbi:MAG: hypothetical protein ABH952_12005 [Candidatus Omnitrophota bacterium]